MDKIFMNKFHIKGVVIFTVSAEHERNIQNLTKLVHAIFHNPLSQFGITVHADNFHYDENQKTTYCISLRFECQLLGMPNIYRLNAVLNGLKLISENLPPFSKVTFDVPNQDY